MITNVYKKKIMLGAKVLPVWQVLTSRSKHSISSNMIDVREIMTLIVTYPTSVV